MPAWGEYPSFCNLDARLISIVAEATWTVKLTAGHVFMVSGFSIGSELDDEDRNRTHQEHVHHPALVKKNRQHKPNQK